MKIMAYEKIQSLEIDDNRFIQIINKYSLDENSIIDNKILFQVYSGRVNFLITNDKAILRKARELYLEDCVFSTYDFLKLVEDLFPSFIDYPVLSIKLTRIGDLNFSDQFFDSLREDYNGIEFNNWLKRKSNEKAYVFRNNEGLQGFLYLKIEDQLEPYNDIFPLFSPKKRLKIGTFKINSTGMRLGERFIKIIFDYALKTKVEEIYVTLFNDKRSEVHLLKDILQEWGFYLWGNKSNGELVLVKSMTNYDYSKSVKYNYPLIKKECGYGVLPIDSKYHTDLFPDLFLKNEDMRLFVEKPCGYAIEKVYVCKYNNYNLHPGDLMVIYRMGEKWPKRYTSVISGCCVLEEIKTAKSYDEFQKLCKNKSVFTTQELCKFYEENKYRTVVKVLFLKSLNTKVTLGDLEYNGIVPSSNSGLRITTALTKDSYELILKLGDE